MVTRTRLNISLYIHCLSCYANDSFGVRWRRSGVIHFNLADPRCDYKFDHTVLEQSRISEDSNCIWLFVFASLLLHSSLASLFHFIAISLFRECAASYLYVAHRIGGNSHFALYKHILSIKHSILKPRKACHGSTPSIFSFHLSRHSL
jgi:hypothetical protein